MANRDVIKNLSATRVTTSSTSYQDALTATGTPTNGSKDFWVLCSAILDKGSTSTDTNAKLIDSTGSVDLCVWNIESKDTSDLTAVFGLAKWTSPSSPVSQSFKLQYSTETAGTVGIDEMCIVAIESHADDEYIETDAETTTTNTSYQDAQTLTFTPASQGDYLIIAYGETNANGLIGSFQLDVDGVASHIIDPHDVVDTTNYLPWMAVHKVNLTAASHSIKIQFKASGGGTARIRRRRILAIRLDTLQANSSDYTSTRGTTTSTTPVDAASTTLTAAGSVDYFAIGNVIIDGSSSTISTNALLSMDGASAALHTREPDNTASERAYAAINYSAFASGSRTVKTQVYSETASVTTGYADRGIYVLDLREAAGAGPSTYEDDIAETLAIVDALTRFATMPAAIAEALAVTDATAAGKLISDAVTEALVVTDTIAAQMVIGGSVSESLSATDAGSSQAVFGAAVSEALSATDAQAGALTIGAAIAESLSAADTARSGLTFLVELSETLGVADAVAASLTIPGAISEAFALTDAAAALATFNPAIAEALGLTDTQSASLRIETAIAEALALTDATAAGKLIAEALVESLVLTDANAAQAAFSAAISELVSLHDAATVTGIYQAVMAENISVADFMVGGRDISVAIAEALGVSDAVAAAILSIVILTGMLRIRPAIAGQANTSPATGGDARISPALDADIETKARVAATATRIRAALAGKTNIGD